ncbi:MAG: hypothetical protein U0990_09760 [Candidatus Nanopelagicales bacterium]|nr:hypothetical protein [Candidatus Nanopelagicales bacterium]
MNGALTKVGVGNREVRAAGRVDKVMVVPAARAGQPDSMAIAKMVGGNMLRSLRVEVRLDAAVGHIYDLGGNGGLNISAAGYDHINKALGVSVYTPETLIGDDDRRHSNPWVQYDQWGTPYRVTVRVYGVGRNAAGNWQVVASTLHYEMGPMLAQDALKKWRKWAGKDREKVCQAWGSMHSADADLDAHRKDATKKLIPIPGGYVLLVDLRHGDVLDVIDNHAHRIRFCTRNAETIARRRVLKVFVGQQKLDPKWPAVYVTAWPMPDRENVNDLKAIVDAAQSGATTVDGLPAQLTTAESSLADPDEHDAELAGEVDDDGAPSNAEGTPGPAERQSGFSVEMLEALGKRKTRIEELADALPPQIVDKCLGDVGLEGWDEVQRTGDLALLDAAIVALEEAVKRRSKSGAVKSGKQGELIPGSGRSVGDPG